MKTRKPAVAVARATTQEESDLLEQVRTALRDRYAVLDVIARGGMGLVLRARERKSLRTVAVKVLDPSIASHLARERFLREVGLCSEITHPRCVPILEAGDVGGLLYYVMAYVGYSLRERLDRDRRLSLGEALAVAKDIAEVLAFAHARDIVHRDIKPGNILLTEGHAVVTDFGIAKAICAACGPSMTIPGMMLGTPGYMSPEQAFGSPDLDARTDVFSLGCVIYEMLVGSPLDVAAHHQRTDPTRLGNIPSEHRRYLEEGPAQVEALLGRMLAWDPGDRPQAAEVSRALGSLDQARTLQPGRVPLWRRLLARLAGPFGR